MYPNYNQSAIPTPPFSPESSTASPHSALTLLDDLVDFYKHERAWIHQTRIALDDAFQHHPKGKSADQLDSLLSPPTDSDSASSSGCSDKGPSKKKPSSSLWSRRKKRFKLRLEDIPLHSQRYMPFKPARPIESRLDWDQRKQVLDMLDKMMEARMESCHRISQLVRDTSEIELSYS